MRILAPRKRDSITGEEVVLSVTNALVTSSRRSISTTTGNNNNNISVTCNGEESTVLVAQTTSSSPPVDLLHEKVFNGRIGSSDSEHVLSSFASLSCEKAKRIKTVTKPAEKAGENDCATEGNNWRNRIGNGVTNLFFVLNAHCCSAQENKSSSKQNEREPVQVRAKDVVEECAVENKVCVQQEEENILKESAGSINACAIIITSEGSLNSIANSFSSKVSGSNLHDKVILSSPGSIHVENTTKPASDTNLVAAVGTANFKIMRTGIYHEKQVKSLCALHALNNLLQDGKAFKQEDLDKICSELDPNSWVNPHKSVFGLGNYDINVIMTALQQKKLEAVWFDKRKDPSEELNFENIYGFILNIPSDCRLGWLALPIKRKHWVAIRNLPSVTERDTGRSNYYNLDSKFDKPESIGTTDNLIEYLRSELKSPEKELFLVVTEDVGKLETWRKNPPPLPASSNTVTGGTLATAASGISTHLLPVPTTSGESGPDAAAGGGNNRRTSNDSGVVDLLPDLRDINVVDLNKEDLMRRQSSGVWSDLT